MDPEGSRVILGRRMGGRLSSDTVDRQGDGFGGTSLLLVFMPRVQFAAVVHNCLRKWVTPALPKLHTNRLLRRLLSSPSLSSYYRSSLKRALERQQYRSG